MEKAFQYKQWADKRTLGAVAEINRHNHADTYAFALQQINHIVIVEELFRSRLEGKSAPHVSTNTEQVPVLPELESRLINSGNWYVNYASSVEEAERQISFVFADGLRGKMSVGEILFHILNHGSYHRGNIAHALDLASVPHPVDGYGIYIHDKEPSRRG